MWLARKRYCFLPLSTVLTALAFILCFCLSANYLHAQSAVIQGINKAQYPNYVEAKQLYKKQPEVALPLAKKALIKARAAQDTTALQPILHLLAKTAKKQANYALRREYLEAELDIFYAKHNDEKVCEVLNDIGDTYRREGFFNEALDMYQQSLLVAEALDFQELIALNYNNIGDVYRKQEQYEKALEFYNQSRDINEKQGLSEALAGDYNNLGDVYRHLDRCQEAINAYRANLHLLEAIEEAEDLPGVLYNMGDTYLCLNDTVMAQQHYKQALGVAAQRQERYAMIAAYNGLGKTALFRQMPNLALAYALTAFDLTQQQDALEPFEEAHQLLYQCYKILEKPNEALKHHEDFLKYKDALFNVEEAKRQGRLELTFDLKRVKERNAALIKDIAIQEAALNKQTTIAISVGFCLLVSVVLGIVLVGANRQKQNANQALQKQNQEIEQQADTLRSQKEEILIQSEYLQRMNDVIRQKNQDITSSITYAQRIQQSVLPTTAQLKGALPQHFVLYKPLEIVSGDFYWLSQKGKYTVLAVGDCTGHGIPGAFMSMVSAVLLDTIVNREGITDPGTILNRLSDGIRQVLNHDGQQSKDGLDISIVRWDAQRRFIDFSGARQSLLVHGDGPLMQFKGTRQGIGDYVQPRPDRSHVNLPFTSQRLSIEPGMRCYLYTDGIIDQFGGPNGQKFMTRRLKDLLEGTRHLPLEMQQARIEKTLNDWMEGGKSNQVDDITLIGFDLG